MKIKICGVKDPEVAYFAAKSGADFIGIVQHPASSRFVPCSLGKEIALAAKEAGASPVAVFVDTPIDTVLSLCQEMGINIVQHYGRGVLLPSSFQRIYVNEMEDGSSVDDFLLLDHSHGKGIYSLPNKIPKNVRCFLAGGLNPSNVQEALLLNPYGIDVSSGVEKDGRKDQGLIEQFIAKVKSYE